MLADITTILERYNPADIARQLSQRATRLRISKNFTQLGLSENSGVSLGSIKRFESSGKISLQNLILIAVVLDATDEFGQLFKQSNYGSIEEVIKQNELKTRKRASKLK